MALIMKTLCVLSILQRLQTTTISRLSYRAIDALQLHTTTRTDWPKWIKSITSGELSQIIMTTQIKNIAWWIYRRNFNISSKTNQSYRITNSLSNCSFHRSWRRPRSYQSASTCQPLANRSHNNSKGKYLTRQKWPRAFWAAIAAWELCHRKSTKSNSYSQVPSNLKPWQPLVLLKRKGFKINSQGEKARGRRVGVLEAHRWIMNDWAWSASWSRSPSKTSTWLKVSILSLRWPRPTRHLVGQKSTAFMTVSTAYSAMQTLSNPAC